MTESACNNLHSIERQTKRGQRFGIKMCEVFDPLNARVHEDALNVLKRMICKKGPQFGHANKKDPAKAPRKFSHRYALRLLCGVTATASR